jgi:Flp pilus assembly protein TadB
VAIGIHGAVTPVIALVALGGLIACGNLLYGKNSHGATAKARVRPAQEAQNRAIDEAQQRARQERDQLRRQRLEDRRQGRQARSGRSGGPQQSGDGPR